MSVKKWTTLSKQTVFSHPRLSLEIHSVGLPNGKTSEYLRFAPDASHSVAIIAVNDKGEILVQQEYSYPPDTVMWQLPGGGMEPGETVIDAANRELSEESGYAGRECTEIGYFYTNNRLRDQKQFVVVCRDLVEHSLPGDSDEFIESQWMDQAKINELVAGGRITNINMLAALNLWIQTRDSAAVP